MQSRRFRFKYTDFAELRLLHEATFTWKVINKQNVILKHRPGILGAIYGVIYKEGSMHFHLMARAPTWYSGS